MSTHTTAYLRWRRAVVTLAATSAATAIGAPTAAATTPDHKDRAYAITINGSNAYPESIAADGEYVYTGSIDTGTVYRGRVGAKTLGPFLPGGQDGRTQVTGVKVDGNRLLLAGAFTGRFFVYTTTGVLVATYTVTDPSEPTLVNDEVVAANGDVYITDSYRAVVYRIPAAEVNAPASGTHRTLQVAYHLPDYVAGTSNANGITTAPDGRSLIIGYWASGALYRLTLATGAVRKIDGASLTSADGIARQGNTLYIDRSVDNKVATVRLSHDTTRATVVSERTYPGIDTPTGVAISGDRLLVTNSQMDTYFDGTPLESPVFTVENLPLH
ncbi:hypothetical protein ACWED2_11820 [Amycolatopsis sp. NPDC005003]